MRTTLRSVSSLISDRWLTRRDPLFLSTLSASRSWVSGPQKPSPVSIIQSASGLSHFDFPSNRGTDHCLWPFHPFASGWSQIRILAFGGMGCLHRRKTWVRNILHCPHHQHRSDTGAMRSFLIRFR
jgi:hypothetical protein